MRLSGVSSRFLGVLETEALFFKEPFPGGDFPPSTISLPLITTNVNPFWESFLNFFEYGQERARICGIERQRASVDGYGGSSSLQIDSPFSHPHRQTVEQARTMGIPLPPSLWTVGILPLSFLGPVPWSDIRTMRTPLSL
jgi:hypothetical protein